LTTRPSELVDFVRWAFGPPWDVLDAHVSAANSCTIVTLAFNGAATYAFGLLAHGPRSGQPPAAGFAEGTLSLFWNYRRDDLPRREIASAPFRDQPAPISVRIEITPQNEIRMRLRSLELYGPDVVVPIVDLEEGVLRGTGTGPSGMEATYLVVLREPFATTST
jgi:hypothetical protein